MSFRKGMRVWFEGPEGRVDGTVIRVNKKTVSVDPGGGGGYFRVPHQMLHAADKAPGADMLSAAKVARLRMTQDQFAEAFSRDSGPAMHERRGNIAAVVENPAGRLSLVVGREDVLGGSLHGWETLCLLLASTGRTLSMAGRLHLEIGGFDEDPRALFQIPEAARWLARLQRRLPWLAAWLDPDGGSAFQLVGSLAPFEVVNGAPRVGGPQLQATVHIANYAVAYTRKLGGADRAHVDAFVSALGLGKLPSGFFDGVDRLQDELDDAGRVVADLG